MKPDRTTRSFATRGQPRPAATAALLGALLLAGCAQHGRHHGAGPGHPGAAVPAGGLLLNPATLDRVLADGGALCVGLGGNAAACTPRPGIKYELDTLTVRPRVDLGALKPAERPTYVVCKLDYRQNPPSWRCTEVYTGQP
jgi:hypothetical protein